VNEEYFLGYYNADKQEPDYFKENGNKNIPNVRTHPIPSQLKMNLFISSKL
jgi:hypothetical protein